MMDDKSIKPKQGRGRQKGSTYIRRPKFESPRSPFEALRYLLKLSRVDWSKQVDLSQLILYHYEAGNICTPVDVAKRMQEEARKMGVAITLDELYQNVVPLGEDYRKKALREEKKLRMKAISEKRVADQRKKKIENERLMRREKRKAFIENERERRRLARESKQAISKNEV